MGTEIYEAARLFSPDGLDPKINTYDLRVNLLMSGAPSLSAPGYEHMACQPAMWPPNERRHGDTLPNPVQTHDTLMQKGNHDGHEYGNGTRAIRTA